MSATVGGIEEGTARTRAGRDRSGLPGDPLVVLVPAVTLLLFVFYYFARADVVGGSSVRGGWHPVTAPPLAAPLHYALSGILLGLAPLLLARRVTGMGWRDLGLGLGDVKVGLAWLAAGLPLAVLGGWLGARSPAMQAVYPLAAELGAGPAFLLHSLASLAYYVAWEALFRGVVLFGLEDRLGGAGANALQTALSVLAHFGRPATETFAALPAGLLFGAVDLRVRSIWYVTAIHFAVAVSTDYFLVFG